MDGQVSLDRARRTVPARLYRGRRSRSARCPSGAELCRPAGGPIGSADRAVDLFWLRSTVSEGRGSQESAVIGAQTATQCDARSPWRGGNPLLATLWGEGRCGTDFGLPHVAGGNRV